MTAAMAYLDAGLSVLPARRKGSDKQVALPAWKEYQSRRPSAVELGGWFGSGRGSLCLMAGTISGNLEMIDFDCAGEAFEAWCTSIRGTQPGLLERLVIESTPSGGRHVVYRCQTEASGNMKLAQRKLVRPDSEPVVMYGKTYVPRKDRDGNWCVVLTLIETRGEGGVFLCAPSVGYQLQQGELTSIPIISDAERDLLLDAAWSLSEYVPEVVDAPTTKNPPPARSSLCGLRPGDDFNARGDVRELLRHHSWTLARAGENEYWRRPGKTSSWSATLKGRVFYVFSSNASPFASDKAYSPFAVYTWLEHNGDFTAAAAKLRGLGYGADETVVSGGADPDLSTLAGGNVDDQVRKAANPGPMPDELLRIPGFVSEVMDHTLQVAPYPNQVLAFCGAVALQAFLAGRRVRDPGDRRPHRTYCVSWSSDRMLPSGNSPSRIDECCDRICHSYEAYSSGAKGMVAERPQASRLVAVDYWTQDTVTDCVTVDVEAEAYQIVDLLTQQGHTSLGFVGLGRPAWNGPFHAYDPDIHRLLDDLRRAGGAARARAC